MRPLLEGDHRRDLCPIDQRGNNPDLLVHELASAAAARRAVRIEGLDFLTYDGRLISARGAGRDAHPDFIRLRACIEGSAVRRVASDVIDAKIAETLLQALAYDGTRQ